MYIVITAAADINVAYSGNDRNEALKTIIIEAWKYILDTREGLPADIPAPGDISRLEDGWSYSGKDGRLNATMTDSSSRRLPRPMTPWCGRRLSGIGFASVAWTTP